MDLAFIIDSSASIGFRSWYRLKSMLRDLLKFLNIGASGTHLAIVSYSTEAELVFNFNTLRGSEITIQNYQHFIENLKWHGKFTFIDRGLLMARDEVFTEEAGMRPDVSKVSVLHPCR